MEEYQSLTESYKKNIEEDDKKCETINKNLDQMNDFNHDLAHEATKDSEVMGFSFEKLRTDVRRRIYERDGERAVKDKKAFEDKLEDGMLHNEEFIEKNVELTKEDIEKAITRNVEIKDRTGKASEHRFGKTRRSKMQKSADKMKQVEEKINALNEKSKSIDTTLKTFDRVAGMEDIYSTILKADRYFAECYAETKKEEEDIKNRAEEVYYKNLLKLYSRQIMILGKESQQIDEDIKELQIKGKYGGVLNEAQITSKRQTKKRIKDEEEQIARKKKEINKKALLIGKKTKNQEGNILIGD